MPIDIEATVDKYGKPYDPRQLTKGSEIIVSRECIDCHDINPQPYYSAIKYPRCIDCGKKNAYELRRLSRIGKFFNGCLILDCISKTIGNWKGSEYLLKCKCGNLFTTTSKDRTKSCGCLKKYEYGIGSMNAYFRSYRNASKINFILTFEQFKSIVLNNCFYCGIIPKNIFEKENCNGEVIVNGIDRIDSSQGYTVKNTVSCCTSCNRAKNSHDIRYFFEWLDNLVLINVRIPTNQNQILNCAVSQKYRKRIIERSSEKGWNEYLTLNQYFTLSQQNCFYCKITPIQKINFIKYIFIHNHVDRLDSLIGYTVENSVACCVFCNNGKNNNSSEYWQEHIERMRAYYSKNHKKIKRELRKRGFEL